MGNRLPRRGRGAESAQCSGRCRRVGCASRLAPPPQAHAAVCAGVAAQQGHNDPLQALPSSWAIPSPWATPAGTPASHTTKQLPLAQHATGPSAHARRQRPHACHRGAQISVRLLQLMMLLMLMTWLVWAKKTGPTWDRCNGPAASGQGPPPPPRSKWPSVPRHPTGSPAPRTWRWRKPPPGVGAAAWHTCLRPRILVGQAGQTRAGRARGEPRQEGVAAGRCRDYCHPHRRCCRH